MSSAVKPQRKDSRNLLGMLSSSNAAQKYKRETVLNEKSEETMAKIEAEANSLSEIKDLKRISYDFKNLKDFPKLGISGEYCEKELIEETKSNKLWPHKPWLTIVNSSGNNNKFREHLVGFPNVKNSTKNQKDSCGAKGESVEKCLHKDISGLNKAEKKEVGNLGEGSRVAMEKCSNPLQRNPNKKKRADPILINLNEILKAKKTLRNLRQDKSLKRKFHRHKNQDHLSGNLLDSSNPKRSRGKHREVMRKRLTNLKLVIIKERIMKQKAREKALAAHFEAESDLIGQIDFKVEIEKYLAELNKRKTRKEERKSNGWSGGLEKVREPAGVKRKEASSVTDDSSKEQKTSGSGPEKELRFSGKLREYCENAVTPDLDAAVRELIKELVSLQDKLFARDPIKAKARRRHVSGIKEVKKHLALKKAKMVIIAPNLEKLQMEGSVFDLINDLKSVANSQNVPCVFALDRYKLGRCTKKNVPVSAFAVLNYEGIEALFENVLRHLKNAKDDFVEMTKLKINAGTKEMEESEVTRQVISSFMSAFREGLRISEKGADAEDEKAAP